MRQATSNASEPPVPSSQRRTERPGAPGEADLVTPAVIARRALAVEAVGRTTVGLVREGNEDRFVVRGDLGLFVVADGMGGHACGDVAATLAVEAVERYFIDTDAPVSERGPESSPRLVSAIKRANTRIHTAAWRDPAKYGMGTTITGLHVNGETLSFAHVGDSRAYRLRGSALEQLTEDHTFANDCVRRGISPMIAAASLMGNALTRALGLRNTVDVEVRVENGEPGDVVLLCTDGVSGVLGPSQIAAALLAARRDLEGAATQILDQVHDEGAPDNATCVLVRWR